MELDLPRAHVLHGRAEAPLVGHRISSAPTSIEHLHRATAPGAINLYPPYTRATAAKLFMRDWTRKTLICEIGSHADAR